MSPRRKAAAEPTLAQAVVPVCGHCGKAVYAIGGKVLMKGKSAAYRHVEPPRGCSVGDPLMEDDVA